MITWKDVKKDLNLSNDDKIAIKKEMDLIREVIEIREREGISQNALAKRTGLKQPAIARLERAAHSPQINTILSVLNSLGYTLKIVKLK